MPDLNNIINVPIPGSPRFENDVAMAISRIRSSIGAGSIPAFETIEMLGLTADSVVYSGVDTKLASVTLGSSLTFTAPTLNTIQDIRTSASPTFVTAKLSGLANGYIPYHVSDAAGLANSNITYASDDTTITIAEYGQFIVDAYTTPHMRSGGAMYLKHSCGDPAACSLYITSHNTATTGSGTENIASGIHIYSTNFEPITSGDFVYGGLHVSVMKTDTSTTTDYMSSYGVFVDNLHLGTAVDGETDIYGFYGAVVVGSAVGTTSYGIKTYASGAETNWAAYFEGNTNITGTLTLGTLTGILSATTGVISASTLLTDLASLTPTDGNFIVGNGTTWVVESGATARTSIGLGTGDTPQFTAVSLGAAFGAAKILYASNDLDSSTYGVRFDFTSSGNTSSRNGIRVGISAGYTGSVLTQCLAFVNTCAGTSSTYTGEQTLLGYRPDGNRGVFGGAHAVTTGINIGAAGVGSYGNTNIGVFGGATAYKASATNIGVWGTARNTETSPIEIGGLFTLYYAASGAPTFESAALLCDNGGSTSSVFVARDNGSAVFTIADGGNVTSTGTVRANTAFNINGTDVITATAATLPNTLPLVDNTYYLGKNDDDTPFAWKGLILKDQAGTGKYYRLEVVDDALVITDLTD